MVGHGTVDHLACTPIIMDARYAHPVHGRIYVISVNRNSLGRSGASSSARQDQPGRCCPPRPVPSSPCTAWCARRPGPPPPPGSAWPSEATALGQLDHDPGGPEPALVLVMDLLDGFGKCGILTNAIRLPAALPGVITRPRHLQGLTHQRDRDLFSAWLAALAFLQTPDEGEVHRLSFANHTADFQDLPRHLQPPVLLAKLLQLRAVLRGERLFLVLDPAPDSSPYSPNCTARTR